MRKLWRRAHTDGRIFLRSEGIEEEENRTMVEERKRSAYTKFGISPSMLEKAEQAERELQLRFSEIDALREQNQLKVLSAFREERVAETDFGISRGYGYNDAGRDKLERVFARTFGAEAALVRNSLHTGTTAISTVLFALLRPGDELLAVSGRPYDTLASVIGFEEELREMTQKCALGSGSLRDFGISYKEVPLLADGSPDLAGMAAAVSPRTRLVHIQRSRGYSRRPALTIEQIRKMTETIKSVRSDLIVFVDNCYGEFTEEEEPTEAGVDIMAGSLIKNPGGGLAPCGGYIAGKKDLVRLCAYRHTAPGIGAEVGASLGYNRLFYQGFYLAPQVVAENLKGLAFASLFLEKLGVRSFPNVREKRSDIVQVLEFEKKEQMLAFVEAIQEAAPVDAFVRPTPAPMPGYDCDVIMAAGAFVQGASIELSADGPLREPYTVYMQGGLVYANIKLAILLASERMKAERESLS